ncbi:NAD-dependent epimerase/dehydratase family protein [Calidifontibacter terrae]
MKYVITGAGQIGTQLTEDLLADGHEVTVVQRTARPIDGADCVVGDAGDPEVLHAAASGAAAIFHCIHAAYDPKSWRASLPQRERVVMDVAADAGIPVVFPESVYAFGAAASDLSETAPLQPCSPLGEVRAELLAARAAHPAITISVVASDLVGPTATPASSMALATVIGPVAKGRPAFVLADPDLPHALTYIPDMSRAMIVAAQHAADLAPTGDRIVSVPSRPAQSLRDLAVRVADGGRARVVKVPRGLVRAAGLVNASMRSLHQQGYLWYRPTVLRDGVLTGAYGLTATPWDEMILQRG